MVGTLRNSSLIGKGRSSEETERKQNKPNHSFEKVMVDNLFSFCLRNVMMLWAGLKHGGYSRLVLESPVIGLPRRGL